MSLGTAPCSGYVLEATEKNLAKLGYDAKTLRKYLIEYCDCEDCKEIKSVMEATENELPLLVGSLGSVSVGFLEQRLLGKEMVEDIDDLLFHFVESCIHLGVTIGGKEIEVGVYRYDPDNGDRYDELHDGYWLIFNEDDLYIRQESEILKALKQSDAEPELKAWTNFG